MIEKKLIKRVMFDECFDRPGIYSFLNPYSFHLLRKTELDLDTFDGFYVDGSLLCFILRNWYGISIERRSFDNSSLAPKLFNYGNDNFKSIVFVGGNEDEVNYFANVISSRYSNLDVKGAFSGYADILSNAFCEKVIKLNPDYIVAGLGTPLQEQFLIKLKNCGWKGVGFSCGGFISQFNVREDYFPSWANKLNLRWLVRLTREPHVLGRLVKVYPKSVAALFFKRKLWTPD